MANRLSLVLNTLVGPKQSVFVKDRKIQDALILAHEMIEDFKGPRHASMALKVDIKKAYNSVSWDFLLKILKGYGFSAREEISVTHAAAQTQPTMNLVFFADDLLIAYKASVPNAKALVGLFKNFEELSGLQISQQKSTVIFSRAVRRKQTLLRVLKCSEEQFPIKYLGLPLSPYGLKKANCQCLIDKVSGKINCWCTKMLSVAGKVELIRSTINPIFLYWCSIYTVPVFVINQLQKMCRNFIWGSTDHSKKLHLMSWDMITRDKAEGGLRLRKLVNIQSASKVVLTWDFLTSKDRLWVSWFRNKYTSQSNYWNVIPKITHSVIWKAMLEIRDPMLQHVNFCIGNGLMFNMQDPRCDGLTFSQRFGHRVLRSLNTPKTATLSRLLRNGTWDSN
ncbi:uncharacterized protein LOC132272684 [Cornus florida]|uniref:uncharacterized protein LOC132272684 n=1 Tax=Cornus florida TaxID=4283 RepID=UPI00289F9539|nr:uncharacterized protein LOC132272684 [Cornus florida]